LLLNAVLRAQGKSEMPYWQSALLGAGIGGAAGLGGSHHRQYYQNKFPKYASTSKVDLARQALNDYDPRAFSDAKYLPEGHTELTYYQKTLSPAAQLDLVGIPAGDLLVALRSNPAVMKRMGTESYALSDAKSREGTSGRQHYEMFARGPVAAYMHQMKSKYHNVDVPKELSGVEGAKYTDWMGRKFEDFVASQSGQRIHPFEVTTDFMPQNEQGKLIESFQKQLSPTEQAFRLKTEDLPADQYVKQVANYSKPAKTYLNLVSRLKSLAVPGTGAAVGALAGHMAHDLVRDSDKEDGEARDWKYWTTLLGGAGLGAAAAPYLREKFRTLKLPQFKKASAWRAPQMDSQAAQASVRSLMSMLQAAPGLSFNQRAQLMSGVSSLDANSARELQRLVAMSGGAAIGVIVARFLVGKGLGSTVLGAMLGGVMGNALFGNSQPRTSTGRPSMSGIDFSGRRF
jgi:hypothetical protein